MNRSCMILGAPILFLASTAAAQESGRPSYFTEEVAAPRNALELTVGTGYTQGLGMLRGAPGNDMQNIATAGLGVNGSVGYRFNPYWRLSLGGEYQEFTPGPRENGGNARGAMFGVSGEYHVMPYNRVDPFVQLGTGYRLLWELPTAQSTMLSHGWDIARLAIGVDFRTSPDVDLAPVIGADITTFNFQQSGSGSTTSISDPRASTFLYAGLQARFDVGGVREDASRRAVAAR